MLGRGSINTVYRSIGGAANKYIGEPVKQFVNGRKKALQNFRNRKDNSNYHRGVGYWKDNTN